MDSKTNPSDLAESGKKHYEREDYIQAAEAFAASAAGFRTAEDALSAAEMDNNRSVALLQAGEYQAALDAAARTDKTFASAGDTRRQAQALGNQAAAMAGLGRKQDAEDLYWKSAQLLEACGEKDLRATVLQAISRLQLGEGRYMQALASMESGLEGVPKPSLAQRLLKRLLKIPGKLLNREP